MKPAKVQYILAHGFRISTWGASAICTGILAWVYFSGGGAPIRESLSLWSAVLLLLTIPLGWFLGGFILWPIVGSVASKINGAPFSNGDLVRILVGQHKDEIVRVYEVWKERGQLRVDLGEKAKKNVADVFSFYEVCRQKS